MDIRIDAGQHNTEDGRELWSHTFEWDGGKLQLLEAIKYPVTEDYKKRRNELLKAWLDRLS